MSYFAGSCAAGGHVRIPGSQKGMTLVELLVALAISGVLCIAAVAALASARTGFSSVDSSSQLRDDARFAVELIHRVGVQAGYKDVRYAATPRNQDPTALANPDPPVFGFNNSMPDATDPSHKGVARTAGVGFGSDVLILRYQAPETFPGSGIADKSVINCLGQPADPAAIPSGRDNVITSILYVDIFKGEPSLMCRTISSKDVLSDAKPMIAGVENFQVLFGADGVTPNKVATIAQDFIADSYLRADQFAVDKDDVSTMANWRRVRSIRVGMVLRGRVGSSADRDSQTFFPLGDQMRSASDEATEFTPTADGRLRQVVTFTIHLRNELDL